MGLAEVLEALEAFEIFEVPGIAELVLGWGFSFDTVHCLDHREIGCVLGHGHCRSLYQSFCLREGTHPLVDGSCFEVEKLIYEVDVH